MDEGWTHIYLIIPGEVKKIARGIKTTTINSAHTAQNTKLTYVHWANVWGYDVEM